jgi:ubiquitin fusion degradation protein 1
VCSDSFAHAAQLNIEYPMLFEIVNRNSGLSTHAGVLEFTAEEGRCYLPYWVCALAC